MVSVEASPDDKSDLWHIFIQTNRKRYVLTGNKVKSSDERWVIQRLIGLLMHKLTEKSQERLFLCKKMGESGDYSIFCRIFATDFFI